MFTKDKEIEIIDKYNSGMSINKIAKEYDLDWHKIEKILIKNNVKIKRQYKINESYFNDINTPNKAYIMGWLYSDGANTSKYEKGHYCISITLQFQDLHILEDIKNEIGSETPIMIYETNVYGVIRKYCRLNICNKHMVLTLDKLGVVPNKTMKIKFPEWLTENLYSHFIRGYFDGDGCITNFGRVQCNQLETTIIGTNDMCSSLLNIILKQCGIIMHLYNNGHKECNDNIKVLAVGGNLKCKKFLDYIYQDAELKLNRKYNKYIDWYYNK